jgi:signal transduction histidine kinase
MKLESTMDPVSLSHYFDMMNCLSKLSFRLKFNNGPLVYNKRDLNGYCAFMNNHFPEFCDSEFKNEKEIHMCNGGLWCVGIPISYKNNIIGYLSLGHTRIEEYDLKTKDKLKQILDDGKISQEEYDILNEDLGKINVSTIKHYQDVIERYVPAVEKYLLSEKEHEDRINELKELSTYLAHSFLIPIQAILAHAENLSNGIKEIQFIDPDLIGECNGVLSEVTKLSYSAENLRDWMAEEKDIYNFDLSHDVPLYHVIREAVELYRQEAFSRKILINGPIPNLTPFPKIKGSRPHLRKVFVNLVNNSVKYSFDGSSEHKRIIEIKCEPIYKQNGDFYCVEISNQGVGVMPDELEKVFESGYRGKLARDRNRFGSGLGLATVKKIIEKHGGSVDLESEYLRPPTDGSRLSLFATILRVNLPLIKGD